MNDQSQDSREPIRRILVIGGGAAGWMTAAYLQRRTRCQIALIESPNIPTIGVGEATIPAMIEFIDALGLDEDEFMRRCHATYKLGIQFIDWLEPNHRYWHPFGLCGGQLDNLDLFHFWLKRRHETDFAEDYTYYSLQASLADCGKIHRPIGGKPAVHNYAYHLDAAAFADYLRTIATEKGVRHVLADVQHVETNQAGWIERVELDDGRQVQADLYIDCTGFKGLLIEQALKDPYLDWSDCLLCDRATVIRLPTDHDMSPYTRATAVSAGWIWRIPLSNRVGCGYVYSSAHVDDDAATRELFKHAGLPDSDDIDVKQLRMRVGRRESFWKANCVAMGLAGGFIEPLESTGLFMIQRGLEALVDCFPDQSCQESLRQIYNQRLIESYEETRDFILLHYYLTRRNDHPFWPDARNVRLPTSLQQRLQIFDDTAMILESAFPVFREMNFYYIYAGNQRVPRRYHGRADFSNFESVCQVLDRIESGNRRLIEQMPTHRDLLEWLHGDEHPLART